LRSLCAWHSLAALKDQPVRPVRKVIQVRRAPLGHLVLPELPDHLAPQDQSGRQDQRVIQAPRQNPNSKDSWDGAASAENTGASRPSPVDRYTLASLGCHQTSLLLASGVRKRPLHFQGAKASA
jgi:hypothetical protein